MSDQIKIVAVGAATQDVFLTGSALTAKRDVRSRDFVEQFPLGAKIELSQIFFDTGGGASNAAVTFARQGLTAEFVGKIGRDPAGSEVLRALRREGIHTEHVAADPKLATGYAAILLAPTGERTILGYRGASHNLQARDFAIRNFRADWFYITSLAGNFDLLKKLLKHAQTHNIQVALTPGVEELAKAKKLKALLPLVSVLLANRQEHEKLFGGGSVKEILGRAGRLVPTAVLTDGPLGSYAADGQIIYFAPPYQDVRVVDRTGAGDAFGSGFVTALARGQDIPAALTLGSANSTAVVQTVGAKTGILKTGRLKRLKIKITKL